MKENYVYPAKIQCEDNMCRIQFLDFPYSSVIEDTEEEAIHSAQEYLALEILDYESRNQELPVPTKGESDVIYIHVKKNVTIPQWLDILAKENKINYSAALVKGIKEILGIEH